MNALPELTRSRCVLLSDFNVRNLAGYLRRDAALSNWDVQETDFGQVMPLLLDATHEVWQRPGDLAVVWTLPQVLQSYEELLDGHGAGLDRILSEVDDFAGLVAGLATRVRTVLVPTWTQDPSSRGLGVLDLRPGGHAHALLRMNQRLADRLAEHSNVFVVDASRWLRLDKDSVSPKHWYFSKTPFGLSVFSQAAQEIRALVDAVEGRAKKLLILDLDNTLWGGIVGDCGWPNIGLGGHDAAGEAYKDFQRALKSLQRRGIILGLVSKNDEKVALEAIDRHPEMVLRRDDFAGWRINWEDKATNILELVRELNLGADAAVFIDDNPAERGRVAAAVPQIFVPSWPTDPLEYRRALEALSCFDTVSISEEDRNRTRSYVAQRRLANERPAVSLREWLTSLDLEVEVRPLSGENLRRVAQLLNKTNQMNLSTRRLTEQELLSWSTQESNRVWAVSVKDRYADHGITGIVSTACSGPDCSIVDFILSCRVFGRDVESVMVGLAVEEAQRRGATRLSATYLKTEKNAPTLEFFEKRSGLVLAEGPPTTFEWPFPKERVVPPHIRVRVAG